MTDLRSTLASMLRHTSSVKLARVRPGRVNYILPYGLGVCFPRCWSGQRSLIHDCQSVCVNCGENASGSVYSVHSAYQADHSQKYGLILPEQPTKSLIDLEPPPLAEEYPILTTWREGGPGGHIKVELGYRKRTKHIEENEFELAEKSIVRFVMTYFRGEIPEDFALRSIVPVYEMQRMLES